MAVRRRPVPAGPLPVDAVPAGDRLLIGYLAATGLLAAATLTGTGAALAGGHAAAAAIVWALGRRPLPGNPPLRFLRLFLPVVVTPLLYTELETLNQLVTPGYLDSMVQGWEARVFGEQLSFTAARRWPHRWLSELLHLGYFSYYFVVPAAALAVWRRAGDRGLERAAVTVGLAFFLCYVVFAVFPVAGPRYEFVRIEGPAAGGPVFELVHGVLEAGSSKGTAFPSSHVAAATAALLAARRDARRWFWFLVVPVALLTVGTVYGRFHYAVDAVAGLAVAVAAYAGTPALVRRPGGTGGASRSSGDGGEAGGAVGTAPGDGS